MGKRIAVGVCMFGAALAVLFLSGCISASIGNM